MMNVTVRKPTQQMLKKLLLIKRTLAEGKKLGNLMAGHHLRMRQME